MRSRSDLRTRRSRLSDNLDAKTLTDSQQKEYSYLMGYLNKGDKIELVAGFSPENIPTPRVAIVTPAKETYSINYKTGRIDKHVFSVLPKGGLGKIPLVFVAPTLPQGPTLEASGVMRGVGLSNVQTTQPKSTDPRQLQQQQTQMIGVDTFSPNSNVMPQANRPRGLQTTTTTTQVVPKTPQIPLTAILIAAGVGAFFLFNSNKKTR